MQSLLRYPRDQRSAVAGEWARRSNIVQVQARIKRGVDAETMRRRALYDARGQIEREGAYYSATGSTQWQVRRSTVGKVNQFDVIENGRVMLTAGRQTLPAQFLPTK